MRRSSKKSHPSNDEKHPSNDENWFASKTFTNLIAFAALIEAVALSYPIYPHIEGIWSNSPEAHFVSPNPAINTAPAGFTVSISSNNIPDSSDLWFIVRAGSQGDWYPYYRIVSNVTWSIMNVCPAVGKQILQIWMVPDAEESTLLTWTQDSKPGAHSQGLTSLGAPSATLLAPPGRTIYITKKCPGY